MKRIALILICIAANIYLRGQEIRLSQSVDPLNVTYSGIACYNTNPFEYGRNSFYRIYELNEYNISSNFQINAVEFGVGAVPNGKDIVLKLHFVDTNYIYLANFNLIDSVRIRLSNTDSFSVKRIDLQTVVPPNSKIAVEVVGEAHPTELLLPGTNSAGETAQAWINSPFCQVEFDGAGPIILNLIGTTNITSVDNVDATDDMNIYPNPAKDIIHIQLNERHDIESVKLINMYGQLCETISPASKGQALSIGLDKYPSNIYLLQLETKNGEKIIKKFFKQ